MRVMNSEKDDSADQFKLKLQHSHRNSVMISPTFLANSKLTPSGISKRDSLPQESTSKLKHLTLNGNDIQLDHVNSHND